MNDIGAKIHISGFVQGVGFRYFTYNIAVELGLKGFVRNREDGSVEVHVEGPEGLVRDFAGRLKVGPLMSRVTGLACEWIGAEGTYTGFEIR